MTDTPGFPDTDIDQDFFPPQASGMDLPPPEQLSAANGDMEAFQAPMSPDEAGFGEVNEIMAKERSAVGATLDWGEETTQQRAA